MKHLTAVTVVFLLSFALLEIKGEDGVATLNPQNLSTLSTVSEKSESSEVEVVLRKWRIMEKILQDTTANAVRNIFPLVLSISEEVNISSQCSKSILKVMLGIKQMKAWAFKMIDASGKIPNGVLSGTFSSLGDFDGCLSVDAPGYNPFRGQYCSLFINPPLPKRKPFHLSTEILPEFANFTKKGTLLDETVKNAQFLTMVRPRTSICVPSTCSREDIASVIDTIVVSVGFPWNISVPSCEVIEPVVFSASEKAIISVLSVIAFLVVTGTVTDVYLNIFYKEERMKMEESSTPMQVLKCFSAYNNTLRLLKEDTSPDSIKIFHGMKVITVLWVALTHIYAYLDYNLLNGLLKIREFGKAISFQVILNAYFDVQTFFFISGVLLAYRRMKFMGNRISIPLYIFHRLWRLTPPFMFVIAASMLIPHLGSGPAWKEIVGSLIDRCKESWWTNLVYINNFFPRDQMCFDWLWYIPTDTHLYFLALIVMIPLKSRPKLALGINGFLFVSVTIVLAATHVYYQQKPTVLYIYADRADINYVLEKSYFRTYPHIPSYCIGLYAGYVLATVPKLKIPKVLNICGWVISVTVGLIVVYGAYDWNQGNVPGLAVSTLYACTSKVLWNLALTYVTIACCTGHGGVITSILSWSAFIPLSRLTFSFYIVHPIVFYMYFGASRTLISIDHRTGVYLFFGTILMSYLVAYAVSMMFESPFMCLTNVILRPRKSPKPPESENNKMAEMNIKNLDKNLISENNMNKIENGIP